MSRRAPPTTRSSRGVTTTTTSTGPQPGTSTAPMSSEDFLSGNIPVSTQRMSADSPISPPGSPKHNRTNNNGSSRPVYKTVNTTNGATAVQNVSSKTGPRFTSGGAFIFDEGFFANEEQQQQQSQQQRFSQAPSITTRDAVEGLRESTILSSSNIKTEPQSGEYEADVGNMPQQQPIQHNLVAGISSELAELPRMPEVSQATIEETLKQFIGNTEKYQNLRNSRISTFLQVAAVNGYTAPKDLYMSPQELIEVLPYGEQFAGPAYTSKNIERSRVTQQRQFPTQAYPSVKDNRVERFTVKEKNERIVAVQALLNPVLSGIIVLKDTTLGYMKDATIKIRNILPEQMGTLTAHTEFIEANLEDVTVLFATLVGLLMQLARVGRGQAHDFKNSKTDLQNEIVLLIKWSIGKYRRIGLNTFEDVKTGRGRSSYYAFGGDASARYGKIGGVTHSSVQALMPPPPYSVSQKGQVRLWN